MIHKKRQIDQQNPFLSEVSLKISQNTVENTIWYFKYDDIPKGMKYVKDLTSYNKRSLCYHGQRKLLMAEIKFLTLFTRPEEKYTILYIGASPGQHLIILHDMFPNVSFILYDPRPLNESVQKLERIKFMNTFFTEKDCKKYNAMKNLLLVSDIRDINIEPKTTTDKEYEKFWGYKWRDMQLQKNIVEQINPLAASLKFSLPWKTNEVTYLSGTIILQNWTKRQSAETRLFCARPYTETVYDCVDYEQKLMYFNTIIKTSMYEHPYDIKFVDHSYDCYNDIKSLEMYLQWKSIPKTEYNENLIKLFETINNIFKKRLTQCLKIIKKNFQGDLPEHFRF